MVNINNNNQMNQEIDDEENKQSINDIKIELEKKIREEIENHINDKFASFEKQFEIYKNEFKQRKNENYQEDLMNIYTD